MARTNSTATDTTRDLADREMAARVLVEDHWAVAALPISERQRARAIAKRAWRRGAPRLRDAWAPRDAELLTRVTDAYDIAALEQADQVELAMRELDRAGIAPALPPVPSDVVPPSLFADDRRAPSARDLPALERLAHAITALRGAADVAFSFARTRPLPPPWDPSHLAHVLRVLSLGALGTDRDALHNWIVAARDARRESTVSSTVDALTERPLNARFLARWDAHVRDLLAGVWLDIAEPVLVGAAHAHHDAVQQAFERLAALREQRGEREAELLMTLTNEMVPRMRAHLQILYSLADATAAVVVWARRGLSVIAAPHARIALADASALAAGDRALDTAFQWLTAAIEQPMIVSGLPAPVGSYGLDTTGASGSSVAVEANSHGPPPRGRTSR